MKKVLHVIWWAFIVDNIVWQFFSVYLEKYCSRLEWDTAFQVEEAMFAGYAISIAMVNYKMIFHKICTSILVWNVYSSINVKNDLIFIICWVGHWKAYLFIQFGILSSDMEYLQANIYDQ